jgi:hypothetical protein
VAKFAWPPAITATFMKDYQGSIEKLRKDAAEAALIRDLATDGAKRETFDRLQKHLSSVGRSDSLARPGC